MTSMPRPDIAAGSPDGPFAAEDRGDHWLDGYLPYQLYRVTKLLNRRLQRRMRAAGLNLSQWRVLSVLCDGGAMNITSIVDRTMLEQPTASRVVIQLERSGMVERSISNDDGRINDISLTAEGRRIFLSIREEAFRHADVALDGLTPDQIGQLRGCLDRIQQNLDFQ